MGMVTVGELLERAGASGLHFQIRHDAAAGRYVVIVDEYKAEGPDLKEALLAAFAAARGRLLASVDHALETASRLRHQIAQLDTAMPQLKNLEVGIEPLT